MSDIPARVEGADLIALRTRQLIHDATCAARRHPGDLTGFARQLMAGRRQRDRFFDPLLFGNPAWDILLAMFVADGEGRCLTAAQLPDLTPAPRSVAARWLDYLCSEGMVVRVPAAGCEAAVRLADATAAAVRAYLGSLLSLGLGPDAASSDIPRAAC